MVLQRGYGLHFRADGAVPGLAPAAAVPPDAIRLHLRTLPPGLDAAPRRRLHPAAGAAGALVVSEIPGDRLLMEYADGTRFVLDRAGTEVWTDWAPPATLEDTATYLLGPVAALLLRLRGRVPLHASAVLLGSGAVALAGPRGAGKSTLAAAFAAAGRTVIADDVLPVEAYGKGFRVHPGYPRVRLWPDSVAALFGRADALPLLTPSWDKRYLPLDAFPEGPFPLRAVYLLEPRSRSVEGARIRPLTPKDGLLHLAAATCATFLPEAAAKAHEFRVLAALAGGVPLRLAAPPDDPAVLPSFLRAIEADAADV